jgi:hypothetical protein
MSLEQIIKQRTDMSEYLVHWTVQEHLWPILRSGFLIASDGRREPNDTPTIRGGAVAVCFSETPAGNYLQSIVAEPRTYWSRHWGIALPKRILYAYGGRPVLYGDDEFYGRLAKEDQYLFCHFNYYSERGCVNWTHEREWRVRPNPETNRRVGVRDGTWFPHFERKDSAQLERIRQERTVPFHLPHPDNGGDLEYQLLEDPQFIILVEKERDKNEIQEFIDWVVSQEAPLQRSQNAYVQAFGEYRPRYLAALTKANVVSLDQIRDERDSRGHWRLEDVLFPSKKQQDEDETSILWKKAETQARRKAIGAIGAPQYKAYEYSHWHELDARVQQRVQESEQAIRILKMTSQVRPTPYATE